MLYKLQNNLKWPFLSFITYFIASPNCSKSTMYVPCFSQNQLIFQFFTFLVLASFPKVWNSFANFSPIRLNTQTCPSFKNITDMDRYITRNSYCVNVVSVVEFAFQFSVVFCVFFYCVRTTISIVVEACKRYFPPFNRWHFQGPSKSHK